MDLLLPSTMTTYRRKRYLSKAIQSNWYCFRIVLFVGAMVWAIPVVRAEPTCPIELQSATQLVLVGVPSVSLQRAAVIRYERAPPTEPWRIAGPRMPAVIGRNGLGWAPTFRDRATTSAPRKIEGDGKTPGGIFRLGDAFGFDASSRPGYVRLRPGHEFCVSDPKSPDYNRILPKKPAHRINGEDMGAIDLYRRGLFIDYPTNAAERAGSCIFVHVWRSENSGTSGCVALAQSDVETMQSWIRPREAVIAILPSVDAKIIESCVITEPIAKKE